MFKGLFYEALGNINGWRALATKTMEDYKVVVAAHASQGEDALAIMNSWKAHCEQLQKENKELIAINQRLLSELGKALMIK